MTESLPAYLWRCALHSAMGLVMVVSVALLFPPPVAYGEVSKEALVEFDFDDPPDTDKAIAPWTSYDAELEVTVERQANFDLDDTEDDDISTIEPLIKLALILAPSEAIRAFLELELSDTYLLEEPDDTGNPSTVLELKQLYAAFPYFLGGLSLQIGRQEFNDKREWLYDEELDAARLFVNASRLGFEFSASRDQLFERDLLNDEEDTKTNRYVAMGRYAMAAEALVRAYVLGQDDGSDDDEDLMFFGIHSSGSPTAALDYWLEGALVRGDHQGTDIRGHGFDLGGTYRWDMRLEPSLTLGFAFGSGDGDPTDSVDHNFRQTGIQNNEAGFSGIVRLKYYGETLDPELSNLQIITLGAGIRPTPESSIELVYHGYRQDEPLDELRDANIEVEPSGNDREIGQAIDLVLGYGEIEDLELELVLGGFFPGRAFSSDADSAYFAGIEITYGF